MVPFYERSLTWVFFIFLIALDGRSKLKFFLFKVDFEVVFGLFDVIDEIIKVLMVFYWSRSLKTYCKLNF
jgi:hypothetical protein